MLRNIMAVSLNGKIALSGGGTDVARAGSGFASAHDHDLLISEIKASDAVIVGASTFHGASAEYLQAGSFWLVYTRRGFGGLGEVTGACVSPEKLSDGRPDDLILPESKAAVGGLAYLRQRNFQRILLLGGGQINSLFYRAGLVDELLVTVCPLVVGDAGAPDLVSELGLEVDFELISSYSRKNHVFLKYRICA